MPDGQKIMSEEDFDKKVSSKQGSKKNLEIMMKMHNLPIREGRSVISKKEMKRRLKDHFIQYHFNQYRADTITEIPQIISANPMDLESDA